MYELKVSVSKVMGTCTANPPVKPGDYFTVRDGDIRIPEGGYICLYALQSLLPVIPTKERKIAEDKDALPEDLRSLQLRREELQRDMREAARELKFEEAARLRDEMHRVEALLLKTGEL